MSTQCTNLSIAFLASSSLSSSSFIALPPSHSTRTLKLDHSAFRSHFSNIVFSTDIKSNLRASKSEFSESLKTALLLLSNSEDFFTEQQRFEGVANVNVEECIFSRCTVLEPSVESKGGALFISQANRQAMISRCNFHRCGAYSDGGAICLELGANHFIQNTCIVRCFSVTGSGQGAMCSSTASIDVLNVVAFQCPESYEQNKGSPDLVFAQYGIASVNNINTSNSCSDKLSGVFLDRIGNVVCNNLYSSNHHYGSALVLSSVETQISYPFFVNDTYTGGVVFLIDGFPNLDYCYFQDCRVIVGGVQGYLYLFGDYQGEGTIECGRFVYKAMCPNPINTPYVYSSKQTMCVYGLVSSLSFTSSLLYSKSSSAVIALPLILLSQL